MANDLHTSMRGSALRWALCAVAIIGGMGAFEVLRHAREARRAGETQAQVKVAPKAQDVELADSGRRVDEQRLAEDIDRMHKALAAGEKVTAEDLRSLIAVTERLRGPHDESLGPLLSALAVMQRDSGETAEAEALLRRAMEVSEQACGLESPEVFAPIRLLVPLLAAAGRLDEALPLARRALSIHEKTLGADCVEAAEDRNTLGLILRVAGQRAEAEATLRRALAIVQEKFGAEDIHLGPYLHSLALVYQDAGRLDEAESTLRRAVDIGENTYTPDQPDTCAWRATLGRVLHVRGNLDEAERLYRRNVTYAEERGAEDAGLVMPLNNLAILLYDTKRLSEAQRTAQRAVEIATRTLGEANPQTRVCAQTLRSISDALAAAPVEPPAQ